MVVMVVVDDDAMECCFWSSFWSWVCSDRVLFVIGRVLTTQY